MDVENLGTSAGAGALAFVASWLALFRRLQKQQADPAKDDKARQRLAALDTEIMRIRESFDEMRAELRRMDERSSHSVTDEELAAYVQQTTQTLYGLTEKVGRLTGAIEASRNR